MRPGCNGLSEFSKKEVHRGGVESGHHQANPGVACRAHRPDDPRRLVADIAQPAWGMAALPPAIAGPPLLSDPRLVLAPDFKPLGLKVLAGEPCILPHITTGEGLKAETSGDVRALTPREREVTQCAATGASNKKIARQLGIGEGTVKRHLLHAYCKLRVRNRVELALALRRASTDTRLVYLSFV
jgi:DNA-binding CsgD family transcriptional regulator